jgi:hypothetical protein
MVITQSIEEQLTDIYFRDEWWHTARMSYEVALEYHRKRVDNGSIHTYEENGEVLGYYERYFKDDICILFNVWVKDGHRKGKVFRELYRHFFSTMPSGIDYISGEKQKVGGKYQKVKIRRIDHG